MYISGADAKLAAPAAQRRNPCTVDDVLARQAGDVWTRATDQAALNESNAAPGLGECPGEVFSRLTAAKDENVVTLGLGHDYNLAFQAGQTVSAARPMQQRAMFPRSSCF
jgi:hypothetical protein